MVAELARDDLVLARLAPELPVVAGHLDVGVGGLPAAGGEVEAVDAGVGEPREALRQRDGVGIRAAGIARCVAEVEHLGRRRVRELLAPVPAGVVPQPREPVDEPVAVGVVEHRALTTGPDPAVRVQGAAVQRVDQVASIPLDEGGVHVVGHGRVLRAFGRPRRHGRCASRKVRRPLLGRSRHGNGICHRRATAGPGIEPDATAPDRNDAEAGNGRPASPQVRRHARGSRLSRGGVFFRACPPSPPSATMRARGRPAPGSPSPAAKRAR